MIEYALVASVKPCESLLAEGMAECHDTGPQPVTLYSGCKAQTIAIWKSLRREGGLENILSQRATTCTRRSKKAVSIYNIL
jgi:hypothetical protein